LLVGATYVAVFPFPAPGVIKPSVTLPPATPLTSQVAALFVVPVTLAVNVKDSPGAMVAVVGFNATRTPDSTCTTAEPNFVVSTVLVATTKKSLVGGREVGAV